MASLELLRLIDEAKRCECAGLDGVWFSDFQEPFNRWPELYVVLSTIAPHLKRAFVGSLITDVLRRHPVVVAHAFATLSHVTGEGRLILGLGAGGSNSLEPYGISTKDSVSKLAEGIDMIRGLWNAMPTSPLMYSGKHFTAKKAGSPLQPRSRIPIYIASYGPRMLRLTARVGDGWVPESHTPSTYKATLEEIRKEMKESGRDVDALEPCASVIFYPFEPAPEQYRRLLDAAKNYLISYPFILKRIASVPEELICTTTNLKFDEEEKYAELREQIPDDLADELLVYGKDEACVRRLGRFLESGCKHFILEPYWIERSRLADSIVAAGRMFHELR
ncbi:MAG: LLM class flavin-dependent oxidoreductase [Nitrososphaerota archaeon]|nr:LLM class flavin-dependent oxidoreductase [Nitrososphaerota archaeon]MDG6947469.1 LLM class flavin-dependent oxidoreductase [Nitrososphaerota archaeon]